jgi:hypothetical protein
MQAFRRLAAAACIATLAGAAFAQTPPDGTPLRITGTIAAFDGTTLTVTAQQQGQALNVTLPPDLRIGAVVDKTLADIKPGDFVGSAAVRGDDGKLHAQEVHIFPESRRGTGEGHRPMAGPQQTMTNATVAVIASDAGNRVLTLKYPSGEQQIEVGPDARIVLFIDGDRSLLKPGATVVVQALKSADGGLVARSVQAEKNGIKPLML